MRTARKPFTSILVVMMALGVCISVSHAWAQDAASGMTVIVPGDIKWQKSKAMPYGMRIMYVYGNPSKPGPYVFRIRVPSGYKIPPVKYPDDRVTTILKGKMWNAEGERYDPMKMDEWEAGTTFVTKAGTPHFQWARTELILQIVGQGPIDNPVTYINPDDDPRNE